MTYINPVFSYGTERFFARAAKTGIEGIILPDVPPEEAGPVIAASEKSGVPIIFLISPTCTDERIRRIDRLSKSWIYLVSLKGVTGARIKSDVADFVKRVRRLTERPLYVGFGISTPDDAKRVAAVADGIVVGSALLKIVEAGGTPRDVERFVASLRRAVDGA
jgi:tryptophan synthase alpha chain